jgi:hypothetical protein
MSFIRNTSLDRLNGLARGRERAPLRRVAPRRRGQRLESFLRLSGMSASAPLIPLRLDTPPVLKHPKTLAYGMSGRASTGLLLLGIPCPLAKNRSYGF